MTALQRVKDIVEASQTSLGSKQIVNKDNVHDYMQMVAERKGEHYCRDRYPLLDFMQMIDYAFRGTYQFFGEVGDTFINDWHKLSREDQHKIIDYGDTVNGVDLTYSDGGKQVDLGEFEIKNAIRKALNTGQLVVFRPEDHFWVGWIGFVDKARTQHSKHKYCVYSRKIKNVKFSTGNEQFHICASQDIVKATQNAKRYLIPFRLRDVISIYRNDIADNVDVSGQKQGHLKDLDEYFGRELAWTVSRKKQIPLHYDELFHLLKNDHHFVNPNLKDKLIALQHAYKQAVAERDRDVNMWGVRMYEDRDGVQKFDTIRVDKLTDRWGTEYKDEYLRHTEDTIDKDLLGRLSVLSMVGAKEHIEGVGIKAMDDIYFVHCDEESDDEHA